MCKRATCSVCSMAFHYPCHFNRRSDPTQKNPPGGDADNIFRRSWMRCPKLSAVVASPRSKSGPIAIPPRQKR
ncbi:uncharacterized protein A1O9_10340 [Exophiala aquamarina CBS 119918]|uniref:Uncharacterized protein n=1 Tax=Exophiala aquamarina CBS 119918 TaxID=1182545 RepID=A0A072PCT8_9EURO|nr:uncharacterized protein A1O9_10340 [Exophiala aquamarina CBS 119918]KEF53365.1 hypothetical protein A1O9_10340 [Exophiala aquamarina CBS 119918]